MIKKCLKKYTPEPHTHLQQIVDTGHNTQIIVRNGQHAQFLVLGEGIRIDDGQTNIGQIHREQIIQTVECIVMQILNGAIGNLNRGDMFQAQLQEEIWAQENGIFGSYIGNNQIGNIFTELLGTSVNASKEYTYDQF